MGTIGEWLQSAEARLREVGVESARLEAALLAGFGLGWTRPELLTRLEREAPAEALDPLLARRLAHEPLAYILGYREFYGRRFLVAPGVLIPRQETEHLVDAALDAAKDGAVRCLDIGTGSGCIAITLKLMRPAWQVEAVDLSEEALEIARANAAELGAEVRFQLSDLVAAVRGEPPFEVLVSNPPYVPVEEALRPEVADYEPGLALYGGETGLDLYLRIARETPDVLAPGGALLLEHGDGQEDAIAGLFEREGWRVDRRIFDYAGKSRVLALSRP